MLVCKCGDHLIHLKRALLLHCFGEWKLLQWWMWYSNTSSLILAFLILSCCNLRELKFKVRVNKIKIACQFCYIKFIDGGRLQKHLQYDFCLFIWMILLSLSFSKPKTVCWVSPNWRENAFRCLLKYIYVFKEIQLLSDSLSYLGTCHKN